MINPKIYSHISTLGKKRLMALLENSSAGITIIENPSGNVTYANKKAISLLGEKLFSAPNERHIALGMMKSDGTLYELDETPGARSLKTGETIMGEEVTFISHDGKKIVVSTNVSPLISSDKRVEAVISVFEDITLKKEIEEQLKYKSFLLDQGSDGILVLDSALIIKYWNNGAAKMYGWTAEEATGQNATDLLQTKYLNQTREEAIEIARSSGGFEVETIQKRKDGSQIHVQSVFTVIKDKNDNITEFIIDNRDITERHRIEVALMESEEKFSKIFKDNPAPILITSLDGKIIDANESCLHEMGYTREEIMGGNFLSNQFYYDPNERKELVKKILEKGSIHNVEFNAVDKHGKRKSYLMSTEIITIRNEKYFISTMLDLSAKKIAEESLRESQEKFSKVFQNNPAAIIINTIEGGRILDANEKASEIFGYSREELLDQTFSMKRIYSKSADRIRMINQIKEKGSVRDFEIVALDKHGNKKNLLISAIIQKIKDEDYIIGSILDITSRRESQEELRKNKAILDAALSSMSDALMITDKKGNLLLINQGFVDFHKCKDIKDCYMKFDDYPGAFEMFTADRKPVPFNMWAYKRALRGEHSALQEYLIKRKDTGEEWAGSYSFSPIKDIQGKITGAVVVSRDITERIKIEKELEENREKLQKANETLELKVEERTALVKETLRNLDVERKRLINVLNMIPAYVTLINKTHHLIFANQVYEKEFGTLDENQGHDFHERERKCEDCKIDTVFKTKNPKHWEWSAPNGKIYDVSDFPFQDTEGNELILEMGIDITEKKDFEMYVVKKVLETEEKSKIQFASDLHDDLGPTLSATKLQLSLLESEATNTSQKETIRFCDSLLSESIHKMRTIANRILPHVLESCGIAAASETFLTKVTNDTHLTFRFKSNMDGYRFDKDTELHLYRIITELITNTIKHSGASKIYLDLILNNSMFEIKYSDNGKGYVFDSDPSKLSGVGLQNIKNRVNIINGSLQSLTKGGNTQVSITKDVNRRT